MQRLWQRISAWPRKPTCIYCTPRNTYLLPLILTPSSPGQWRSYSALSPHQEKLSHLADFYRALATQDIDRIWPLYTYLYHNDMLSYLTKRNYYQLFTYTVRSRACQKNLHRLLAIVDDMRMKGYGLRVGEYNAVIHWVGGKTVPTLHTRHLIDALTWFEDMQKSSWRDEKSGQEQHQDPVQPTIVTFNSLIHIAAELSDLRTAQKLYHDMMSRGIEPDRVTYATLLHAMSRIGDVEGMDSMLKDLRQKRLHHVISSTLIWNVLMTGYATHGHKKKAYDMFNQMLQMTSNKTRRKKRRSIPTVDAESFKICIDLMLQDNRQAKAIQLLFRMKEYNIQPIVTIYNTLFASFKQPQDLALLKSVYQHMKETQVKPNSDTMYTLVSAFLDLGDTTSGLQVFVDLSNTFSVVHKRHDIQTSAIATLAKERLLIQTKDPAKIEPKLELLERLNSIVANKPTAIV